METYLLTVLVITIFLVILHSNLRMQYKVSYYETKLTLAGLNISEVRDMSLRDMLVK